MHWVVEMGSSASLVRIRYVLRSQLRRELTQAGGQDDGDGRAELHGETARGRLQGEAIAQVAHDVVAVGPDTDDEHGTAKDENPDGDLRLALGRERAVVPDLEDGGVRADGVGDVVGTVGEGGGGGGHDLQEAVHVLGLVVEVGGVGVDLVEVAGELAVGALGVDDLLVDTAEQRPLDIPEEHGALEPLALGLGPDDALAGLGDVGQRARGRALGRAGIGTLGVGGLFGIASADNLDVVTLTGLPGVQLGLGQATLVVILEAVVLTLRRGRDLTATKQEGAERDVIPAEGPVTLDDDTVHPGHQSQRNQEAEAGADTDDGAGDLGVGEGDGVGAALPQKQHGEERCGQAKVEGHDAQSPHSGVVADHDAVFGDQEDDGRKAACKTRGDNPGEEDLDDTRVDGASSATRANPLDTCESHVNSYPRSLNLALHLT